MKKFTILLALTFLIFTVENTSAKSFRVMQMPNGSSFQCLNCHVNPGGGHPLTDFGSDVEESFLSSGNLVWNAELAAMDSDGDGFTNGQELQDPDGTWTTGNANPGDASKVTNPGDASSKPDAESVKFEADNTFTLSAYPNPFTESITIRMSSSASIEASIEIFSVEGTLVSSLNDGGIISGDNSYYWNGSDLNGNQLASGTYIIYIKSGDNVYSDIIKLDR